MELSHHNCLETKDVMLRLPDVLILPIVGVGGVALLYALDLMPFLLVFFGQRQVPHVTIPHRIFFMLVAVICVVLIIDKVRAERG